MTKQEFWKKYEKAIKVAPKQALIEIYKRIKKNGEIGVDEAYALVVDHASPKELLSLYMGEGRKLRKLMKQEQQAIEFFVDLKALAEEEAIALLFQT